MRLARNFENAILSFESFDWLANSKLFAECLGIMFVVTYFVKARHANHFLTESLLLSLLMLMRY